jgi:hypothetical protein
VLRVLWSLCSKEDFGFGKPRASSALSSVKEPDAFWDAFVKLRALMTREPGKNMSDFLVVNSLPALRICP